MLIFALLFTSLNDTNSENVLNFVFEDQISFMINDEKIESEYSLEGYLTESSSGILIDLYSITIDGTAFEFEQKISTNYTFLEFKENQKTNPLIKDWKYSPVPPTKIGIFFLFFISFIFFNASFNHCPVEKFLFASTTPNK